MLAKTFGGAVQGIEATIITVEINVMQGQKFHMSGLPDSAVKESQHRVESSLKHLSYHMPRTKIVVNLAPADIRKEGSSYDLPIALSLLKASGQIKAPQLDQYVIMGELSLAGQICPINGSLSIALEAKEKKIKGFILPTMNAEEAAVTGELDVIGVKSLQEAIDFLEGKITLCPVRKNALDFFRHRTNLYENDFCDVREQENIKRALEIAAAGGHNVIMIGPPGAGKTMLAKRLPSILPPFTMEEALETTKIHSVAGKMEIGKALIQTRPFRSPHHTISDVALVGGGTHPQPGEISLAHNGVLFLDELPEFKRSVLEVMRQPMEERKITISRAKTSTDYPANFMLIASMNPCPCGYYNHPHRACVCPHGVVRRYISKVSGPLLDRVDIHIEVTAVNLGKIKEEKPIENSASIRERVIQARLLQQKRFSAHPATHCNAMMSPRLTKQTCLIDVQGLSLLRASIEQLGLSARAYDRILKVSRTIADLAHSQKIETTHLAEAIQYRSLDKENWAG